MHYCMKLATTTVYIIRELREGNRIQYSTLLCEIVFYFVM